VGAPDCSCRAPTTSASWWAQYDTIVAFLRERGMPVEPLVADDEGHGFADPQNRMRLNRAVERHFAVHLGGRPAREPGKT
jgi:dipeptidyl aminopeptidase/acylaminoacyl peptidase